MAYSHHHRSPAGTPRRQACSERLTGTVRFAEHPWVRMAITSTPQKRKLQLSKGLRTSGVTLTKSHSRDSVQAAWLVVVRSIVAASS